MGGVFTRGQTADCHMVSLYIGRLLLQHLFSMNLCILAYSIFAQTKHPCILVTDLGEAHCLVSFFGCWGIFGPPVRPSPLGHRTNVVSVLLVYPGVFQGLSSRFPNLKLLERSSIGSGDLCFRKVRTRYSSFSWLLKLISLIFDPFDIYGLMSLFRTYHI